MESYRHTQTGYLILISSGVGAALVGLSALFSAGTGPDAAVARVICLVVLAVLLASAFLFSTLTIRVGDGRLSWRFGPGLIRNSASLADVERVEPARTSVLEGWGIHLTRRGWLYNVSGRDAVHVRLRSGRQFMLGTDEPDRLVAAIRAAKTSP